MAYTELYVRDDAAGGGNGTTNTNSGANGALTYAEMLAYGGTTTLAGKRFNIRTGTYTRTAATDTFSVTAGAATAAAPCAIRGFNSTIGDLDTPSRAYGGALTITNHPVISYGTSGSLVFPAFCEISNISATSSINGATFQANTANAFHNCKFENTNASGLSSRGLVDGGSDRSCIANCDFVCLSTNSSAYALATDIARVIGCRISCGNGASGILISGDTFVFGTAIFDVANGVVASGQTFSLLNCSFRNVSGNAIQNSTTGASIICNCVAWLAGGSSVWVNNVSSARALQRFNNCQGNAGSSDVNPGDWTVRDQIALSADPFESSTDLSLNATTGGGAECREIGLHPFLDAGAWQVQPSGGGSGGVPLIGAGGLVY